VRDKKRVFMTGNNEHRSGKSIPAFVAFIPFGNFLICHSHPIMLLRWASLATILESISLLSIYVNITTGDLLWSMFGIWVFIIVCTPVYLNIVKAQRVTNVQKNCDTITFMNLFKMCLNAVFSDYRIALTAEIPLVTQVLVGGSILYGVLGADWIIHALAGFGIVAVALKAYKTAVNHYRYSCLVSYFHLDRLRFSVIERKTSSLGFTLFSLITVALIWEFFETGVHFMLPINVFRIGAEPLWNIIGDIVSAITGGMIAWYLIECKLKWL
jgi:hypothetical protein